ncbi:MAG: alcohol dehydrogenase catalytic domain-containing protein [Anaerolineae bacterium]|nr:alcohol dehydrogenase catalytic domain-containing protein [Anaerolineae bacterium]
MKAVMLWEPERMECIDIPMRPLGRGEVRLKVEACAICGSDLEGYHGLHPTMTLPRVMGHEVASTVAEVGPGVQDLSVGDRIAGIGRVSCGVCAACRNGRADQCVSPLGPGFTAQGAYAEYLVSRAEGCTLIPEGVSFVEAAVAQPAGIANHAVATRAHVERGETILIQGCGPIGLSAMMLAKLRGATVISTDIVDYRCDFARQMGADLALNAHRDHVEEAVRDLTGGRGADKVIECVGGDQDETIPEAVTCVKDRGLVAVVGSFAHNRATLPVINFKFKEKTVLGSQSMPEGYEPIFELLLAGKLDLMQLVTHRLSIGEAQHGLELMDAKADRVLKVVLEP